MDLGLLIYSPPQAHVSPGPHDIMIAPSPSESPQLLLAIYNVFEFVMMTLKHTSPSYITYGLPCFGEAEGKLREASYVHYEERTVLRFS